jgi:hypothetical protein
MQVLVIDSKWQKNTKSGFDFGILVWRETDNEPNFIPLQPSERISWTILGPKRCIGSRTNTGVLKKCPDMTVVGKDKHRCGPCSAIDAYDPCIRCTGQSCNANKERAEKCEQTDYAVYLALFSDKSLKVGVSVEHRLLTRWVEQGADYGLILAKVKGGMKARNIEHHLFKKTILRKSVHPSSKSRTISNILTEEEAHDCLIEFKRSIDISLSDFDFNYGKFTNLNNYYNLNEVKAKPIRWLQSNSRVNGKQLFGTVVGMKGSFLITKIKNAYTIANIRRLIGYSIDCEQEIKVVTQSGLLDYL